MLYEVITSYIKFDENAVVIVDKEKKEPKANRVFGPIPREVSEAGYQRIASMAPEVLVITSYSIHYTKLYEVAASSPVNERAST